MPWGVVAGAVIGAGASVYGANKQSKSANAAADLQRDQYNQTRADQAPYREAGATALGQIGTGTAPGGQFSHQFNADDLKAGLAPNYDFILQQGQQANQHAAGVSGGLVGGNALKGLQDYTQNAAGNAYQQAFSNYTANQTNIFNRLASIAGIGQTSNQVTANAGANAANAAGGYLTSGAAAGAAGVVGAANAANNGIGNYLGWQYLNKSSPSGYQSPYAGQGVSQASQNYGDLEYAAAPGFASGGAVLGRPMAHDMLQQSPDGVYQPQIQAQQPPMQARPPTRVDGVPMGFGAAPQPAPTRVDGVPIGFPTGSPRMGIQPGTSIASMAGPIYGPGTQTSDSIPARLSNGEHVMDAGTVTALGNGNNLAGQAYLNRVRSRFGTPINRMWAM